eukprot:CAMPEP_0113936834 /NCGR_PEP_ID=MMETSP1339-20121228/3611_1 /TAXON_ID=94617 /ORGANISM="Fibrocapsa japonica" /LENGTH=535 /DNA_ID=CAMNT_0000939395 /DNA_START=41 /DNA_END=1644 /DNA_ORIENTATION=- /assembly_acc=CAM_ASM_000762
MNKLASRFMKSLGIGSPKDRRNTSGSTGSSSRKGKKKDKRTKSPYDADGSDPGGMSAVVPPAGSQSPGSFKSDMPPPPPPATGGAAAPPPPSTPPDEEGRKAAPRRFQIINESDDAYLDKEEKADYPKSVSTRQLLSNALRSHFLFSEISAEDLRDVVSAMAPCEKQSGEDVVTQGDSGTEFYVLEMGKAEVLIDGRKVREYGPGGSFGELALMYNAKRAATVRAVTPSVLWTMDLRTFRRILASTSSTRMVERCEFLQAVEILNALKYEQISKLAGALDVAVFEDGTYIIRQGEMGETFYIIEQGEVYVTQKKSPNSDEEDVLAALQVGQYFGEMALLLDEPRMANCVAKGGQVKCLTLDRARFIELLGPLQDLLTRNMQYRILQSVPLLSNLTAPQLDRCVDAMRVEIFQDQEFIVRAGEEGSKFYIINSGEVAVSQVIPSGERKVFGRMGKQEYFGEQALLKNEPRTADVIAVGEVACFVLERKDFGELLKPLQALMEGEHERRTSLRNKFLEAARGGQKRHDDDASPTHGG